MCSRPIRVPRQGHPHSLTYGHDLGRPESRKMAEGNSQRQVDAPSRPGSFQAIQPKKVASMKRHDRGETPTAQDAPETTETSVVYVKQRTIPAQHPPNRQCSANQTRRATGWNGNCCYGNPMLFERCNLRTQKRYESRVGPRLDQAGRDGDSQPHRMSVHGLRDDTPVQCGTRGKNRIPSREKPKTQLTLPPQPVAPHGTITIVPTRHTR